MKRKDQDRLENRRIERPQVRRVAPSRAPREQAEVRRSSRLRSRTEELEMTPLKSRREETQATVRRAEPPRREQREDAAVRSAARRIRSAREQELQIPRVRKEQPAPRPEQTAETQRETFQEREPQRVVRSRSLRESREESRIRPQQRTRVQRSMPEKRTRVASDYTPGGLDEPSVLIDGVRGMKPLPTAEFGSQRAHSPIPPMPRQSGGKPVDKASFAAGNELHFRHELKFYINYRDYMVLRQALKALLAPDENGDENNSYHIRSLYFDDRDETALVDKLAGVEERNKYRIRIYNFSDQKIRLEKKIKRGQYIAKQSLLLSRKEYNAILNNRPEFLLRRREPLAREFFLEMRLKQLRPRVVVDYVREAYIMAYEEVRITFDKDLKSGRPFGSIFDKNLPVVPIADAETMILEVKFNKYLPDYVRGVLDTLSAPQRSAISKYVNCRKYE